MTEEKEVIEIVEVTPENVSDVGIFCIKDKSSPGQMSKVQWFRSNAKNGLKILIAKNAKDRQLGFIEYVPSEYAWRPVNARNYLFIQCIALFVKDARNKRIGSTLLKRCEDDARKGKKSGVCVMASDGVWMANKSLFLKNGFEITDSLGRFELLAKKFRDTGRDPAFKDWTKNQSKYIGWNLIYSDQCPWHEKSVTDLKQCASDHGIDLKVQRLESPRDAQDGPSGFGVFGLLKDGEMLADHYISSRRFENILHKQS